MADNLVASLRSSAEWIKEMEHESWLGTAELQIEAADALQQRDDEIERLRALVDDYENGINWYTTCTNCAKLLEDNYDQYCQIERLRAALHLAVGELSTHSEHRHTTPDLLVQQFLEEARREQ